VGEPAGAPEFISGSAAKAEVASLDCRNPKALGSFEPSLDSTQGCLQVATNTTESWSLSELAAHECPLHAIQIPKGILELAEEIVSHADSPGIERDSLLFLLRAVLFLDRQNRRI
jgi:hypothetical protein